MMLDIVWFICDMIVIFTVVHRRAGGPVTGETSLSLTITANPVGSTAPLVVLRAGRP